jgi:hypothetical protein
MSEFRRENQTGFRWGLLTTVSAIALLGIAYSAKASDDDRPPFWIELGGQFAQEQGDEEVFSPAFLSASPFDAASHTELEKNPLSSWGGNAEISFEPVGADWVFSASILYGKNNRSGLIDQQTAHGSTHGHYAKLYQAYQIFSARSSESHTILDFQAGKDIGLGMFGRDGRSTINFGVRYAQFEEHTNASIHSQPTNAGLQYGSYHKFHALFAAQRRFSGIGPSLSWNSSASLAGNPSESEIAFDWGFNGAVLFGRQRAQTHHQSTNDLYKLSYTNHRHAVSQHNASPFRNRQVTVPNLGGFAGLSWSYPNAKVSIGYRADFFFGAIDGGIDTVHRGNIGFYGPFATVSIGIGG